MKKILDTIVRPEEVDAVVKAARTAAMQASTRPNRWVWPPKDSPKRSRALTPMTEAEYRRLNEESEEGLSKTMITKQQVVPLPDGRVRVYLYASAFHVRPDGFKIRSS